VIHNGRAVRPAADTARRPVVLGAGRLWDEAKNLQALVAVAPALPWPVELAGDLGENEDACAVTCLGRLPAEALLARMGKAEIFCSPARYEPFGLAALEAGMQGAALVLGDIPAQREIWGDAALFVPPDDTAALEVALLRLIRDPDERRQLQAAARARAARYTRERMTEAYLDLYSRIVCSSAEAA
jgi:glycosyltransferase involved in cell wall biosynthesis